MAGTALTIGVIGAAVVLSGGVVVAGAAAVVAQSVSAAADAAALAAADVASGALPSQRAPCTAASDLANAHGATLVSCEISGPIATVAVSKPYAGMSVVSTSRAGPPSAR